MILNLEQKKLLTAQWFQGLRDQICIEFEKIELEFLSSDIALNGRNKLDCKDSTILPAGKFVRTNWQRKQVISGLQVDGGFGEMSIMKGNVFEKVGVNFSKVHGQFSEEFCKEIPGAQQDPSFFATGISLVAHMRSPIVPSVHINTRFICTTKDWFGGGSDLNPAIENADDIADFHCSMKNACDQTDSNYYPKFKQWCDEYFFIKHRNVARGAGGIFYDYLNSGNFEVDFDFTKKVGLAFLQIFPQIVRRRMLLPWNKEQKDIQLQKRGLYAEFNLIYDRGTKFGLVTGGNVDAILMSLPPEAVWL